MSQAPNAESRQAPADVAQSLFWDDVRTGLKVVCVGLILLLVGELSAQFRLHDFLVGAAFMVGAVLTLIGLGICTAVPKETGVSQKAIGAAACAALGILAMLLRLVIPADVPVVGALPAVLSAVALVLFALVLRGCVTYIGHRQLTAAARSLVSVATGFALLLVVVSLSGLVEHPALRVLVDLLAIGIVGMFVYIAWGTSDAILRVRQGLPLETPRFATSPEYLAAEEQRLARENVTYAPPPPPHFSETEVRFFHTDDAKAATAIVMLMAGIFSVGVVLYSVVAWTVAS